MAEAGLPPAHVGLHAGPVIFQEGDYYGQTVNVASRIADYARPGEVLVSQEVVDASGGAEVAFREIGPVELKGVAGAVRLHAASRAGVRPSPSLRGARTHPFGTSGGVETTHSYRPGASVSNE